MLPQACLHICVIHLPKILELHIKVCFLRNKEISKPFLRLSFGRKTSFSGFPAFPLLIRKLNQELEKEGFLVIAGKVPRRYFEKRGYGFSAEEVVE